MWSGADREGGQDALLPDRPRRPDRRRTGDVRTPSGLGRPPGPPGRRPTRRRHPRGEAMTLRTIALDTFVIERTYDVAVTEVFRAWADPGLKARWFAVSAEAL